MTGEEGAKVVSNNSVNITSSGVGDVSSGHAQRIFGDSSLSSGLTTGPPVASSINNEQSGRGEIDVSTGDSSIISDLSRPPINNNNNLKEKNSVSVNEVESGDLEGISTNSPSEGSNINTPYSHSQQTPQKRNGRIDSSSSCGGANNHIKEELLTAEYPILSEEELTSASKEGLVKTYHELQQYIQTLKSDNAQLKDSEEKMRLQQLESSRRENVLVMRLTTKEQELQEYVAQLNELKSAMAPTPGSLRSTLLDPAVNLIIQRMKKELNETKKKLEDTQNDLNAWKFTPDSNTGKRLMAKCRMLYQENEDLGKMITSGRLAKLESDLALQRSLADEMKKSQSELDELIQELDEDVEGMQSTIYFLQQEVSKYKPNSLPALSAPNSLINNTTTTHSTSDLMNVIVSELCAQCRAIQEDKIHQAKERRGVGNSSCLSNSLKMEIDDENEIESSLKNNDNFDDTERTCVNGESSVNHSERSQRPPRATSTIPTTSLNERTTRATRTSKHSLVKSDSKPDEDESSDNNVRKIECVESTNNDSNSSSGEIERVTVRTKKTKLVDPPLEEGSDGSGGSSYTSPPLTKRTKLANHSPSATLKRLNPVQVQNSNNETVTSGSSVGNRNGSVDH